MTTPRSASATADYDVNAGRNAFRRASGRDLVRDFDKMDPDELRRQQFAMRSFTESIEMDMPPPPELPPSLDIDQYGYGGGMRESSTGDTIVEVTKFSSKKEHDEEEDEHDHVCGLGETQKYIMTVPGPGHVDQEIEMHKSLLKDAEKEESDLDSEVQSMLEEKLEPENGAVKPSTSKDADLEALRNEYKAAIKQRPRPTTPTSKCVIDSYVEESAWNSGYSRQISTEEKIKVSLPGHDRTKRKRQNSMNWSDFYENMAQQMPPQGRRASFSVNQYDYDADIIEQNPKFADKAPPKPVVHRRQSVEWENFEEANGPTTVNMAQPEGETTTTADVHKEPEASSVQEVPSNGPTSEQPPSTTATTTGGVAPVRAAPPPPPKKKTSTTEASDQQVPDVSAYQDSGYQGTDQQAYDYSSYGYSDTSGYYGGDTTAAAAPNPFGDTGATANPFYGGTDAQATTSYEQYGYGYPAADAPGTGATDYGYNYASGGYGYDGTTGATADTSNYGTDQYGAAATADATAAYAGYGTDQYGTGTDPAATAAYADPYGAVTASNATAYSGYGTDSYGTTGYDAASWAQEPAAGEQVPDATATDAYSSNYAQDYTSPYGSTSTTDAAYGGTTTTDYSYSTGAYGGADTSAYGGGDVSSSYQPTDYDTSYYGGYVPGSETTTAAPAPPTVTFAEPVLPPSRPRDPDPFSWEAQETSFTPAASATSPSKPPPPRPPPARTPEPDSYAHLGAEDEAKHRALTPGYEDDWGGTDDSGRTKSAPPPRPVPPPAGGKGPPRPPAPSPQPVRPPPPSRSSNKAASSDEEEEDAWAKFKKMTDQASSVAKNTEEQLKSLAETSAAKDIKDESYLSEVGGSQGFEMNSGQRQILQMQDDAKKKKAEKKQMKALKKKPDAEAYVDPKKEEDLDRAAAELAMKMAAMNMDLQDWKPPTEREAVTQQPGKAEALAASHNHAMSPEKEKEEGTRPTAYEPIGDNERPPDEPTPEKPAEPASFVPAPSWAGFEDDTGPSLPPSESGFFSKAATAEDTAVDDSFVVDKPPPVDPFAPATDKPLFEESYDPFDIRPVDEIIEEAKKKAELEKAKLEAGEDVEFFGARASSRLSTPTPEGGSPTSSRPMSFEDDFKADTAQYSHTPTPLYDEDDTYLLTEFPPKFTGDGWELTLRHPLKKKNFMSDRFWKPCYVRLSGSTLLIYNSKDDNKPIQETLVQASYSLSPATLQAYDVYGKIHTVKLQHILYKERVGIRAGQISRLVEGHITKYGLPLEHAAQCTVLAKFGSLNGEVLQSFINTIEDTLFACPAKRESAPVYKQDEVQIHCYDEYYGHVDKDGRVHDQKARVRMFCLAFLSGTPLIEIGLNDRRREGKEVVRRKDILPMYTERWIRFENVDFHQTVDKDSWEKEQVVRMQPPDGCFLEMMRFRIRPPRNREKPLSVKCVMKIAGSKIEIRIDAMPASMQQRARGTVDSTRIIPCEDIQIRFPIPEAWIYIFREERHWGVGSVHAKSRKPGKVKNLKDRIMGAVQHTEQSLIEVAVGEAKYEHLFRSLVWRIPRLPEKAAAAYKEHMLKCRFDLSSFDLMPEQFLPACDVEFTMPLATISNTVVRSVSVEQHEDSDRVEKFVRYVAKCQYTVDIDYVQCNDLDNDAIFDHTVMNPEATMNEPMPQHKPIFDPEEVQQQHTGYRIDVPEHATGNGGITAGLDGSNASGAVDAAGDDSSSDDDIYEKPRVPNVQINMSGYGY